MSSWRMREIWAQTAVLSAAKEEFESGSCKQWVFGLATGILVIWIQASLFLVLNINCALYEKIFLMKVLSKPACSFEKR